MPVLEGARGRMAKLALIIAGEGGKLGLPDLRPLSSRNGRYEMGAASSRPSGKRLRDPLAAIKQRPNAPGHIDQKALSKRRVRALLSLCPVVAAAAAAAAPAVAARVLKPNIESIGPRHG